LVDESLGIYRVIVFDILAACYKVFSDSSLETLTGDAFNIRNPTGIAFNKLGNLYVSDSLSDSIYVYEISGKYIGRFVGDNKLYQPSVLAFSRSGEMVVHTADRGILVFGAGGSLVNIMPIIKGDTPTIKKNIAFKNGVTLLALGTNPPGIHFFNRLGYVHSFRCSYNKKIMGISIGGENNIFTSHYMSSCIIVYNCEHDRSGKIYWDGLRSPSCMAVDDEMRLYVADIGKVWITSSLEEIPFILPSIPRKSDWFNILHIIIVNFITRIKKCVS
jgi:hypothetical protein